MSILSTILSPVATKLIGWLGGYNATDPRRKILDPSTSLMASKASANQLLNGNLSKLRDYCRNLERNNPTARAAVEALKALVVGNGIALEPDTGDAAVDSILRDSFNEWCESCGVNGESIWQLQSLCLSDMVIAGEGIWRLVGDETDNAIPLSILPLDSEWLVDSEGSESELTTVAGIQLDRLGRPIKYLLANPETGEGREIVGADDIVHVFERRRPVQHRGEPWMTPVIETLMQERDLVDAELKAAVNTASLGISIESDYHGAPDTDTYGSESDPAYSLKLGSVVRLLPGEKVNAFSHTRPSQQIAPFRQMLRGDIAAALRIPQRFLDRDVSRANYSSMRADMLDTERLLAPLREWFGKNTIGSVYERVLPYLAAKNGIKMPRKAYRLIPDGQPYVDPQKDIRASIEAIEAGLSTYESEIGKRGGDYRQVWAQIARENELRDQIGILTATEKEEKDNVAKEVDSIKHETVEEEGMNAADRMRMERMERMIEGALIARSAPNAPGVTVEQRISMDEHTASVMGRAISEHAKPSEVRVDVSPTPIHVDAPRVEIRAEAPVLPAPVINIDVPVPSVNVAAPSVTVQNEVVVPQRKIVAKPGKNGEVIMTPVEE